MKTFKIISIFTIAVLIFTISCKNDDLDSKLYGTWTWLESSGGYSFLRYTPETEGYYLAIEFDKSGNFKIYKNEQLETIDKFTIKKGKSIYTSKITNLLEYKEQSIMQSIEFVKNDTLILRDECYDCFTHIYVKK